MFTLPLLSLLLGLCSARVIPMKSLTQTMTMRQAAADPFASFLELNARADGRRRQFIPINVNCIPSSNTQSLDGTCNNIRVPTQGAADSAFVLQTPAVIYDFASLPNARLISNIVCEEAKPVRNSRGMSELVTFFGQLIDHTVTETVVVRSMPLPISIPPNDPVFKPTQIIPFFRSAKIGSGTSASPLNRLSSYLDAASIYAVDPIVAKSLRTMTGGRMKLPGGLLTTDSEGFFISGDDRVNENPNLTALHLLFTREHNAVAEVVETQFPTLDDEGIYQLSRSVVAAQMQAVFFEEFIPTLTGQNLPKYSGYKESVNSGITNEFSTVAFRVGHTLLNSTVTSISSTGVVRNRLLRDSFFNPAAFRQDTIEGLLRGMMSGFASEVDAGITGEVRNFLVDEGNPRQLDLAALNIQRGRDHGVQRYNNLRTVVGLPKYTRFNQITSDINLQVKLETAYNGVLDDIDPWVGGISEDREVGSFGPLFARLILREARRLRDGDRFYFENNRFTAEQISKIPMLTKLLGPGGNGKGTMRNVIIRNTAIPASQVKSNPFFV